MILCKIYAKMSDGYISVTEMASFCRGVLLKLSFWYEYAARRAENRGLENRMPPNLGS